MKTLFQIIVLVCCFTITGCEQINERIVKHNLNGIYKNTKGNSMEFTETMCTLETFGSFPYKVEGKYIYIENIRFLEAYFGTAKLEVVDANTIKSLNKRFSGENDLFKKVKE